MQNEIYDEKNGLTYMLCGDYYLPKLALTDIEPTYGKYGMLRKSYLQEHRKAKYQILLLQGKLAAVPDHFVSCIPRACTWFQSAGFVCGTGCNRCQ